VKHRVAYACAHNCFADIFYAWDAPMLLLVSIVLWLATTSTGYCVVPAINSCNVGKAKFYTVLGKR
jgi:hypothetical protein